MQNYKFLLKSIKVATPIVSPFVILTILTPITNIPLYINIFCIFLGLLTALLIIYRLKSQTVVIQFKNKGLFISELDTQLRKIGYVQIKYKENIITYCGTPETSLFAEDIIVRLLSGKALITAPKTYLKKLINSLPLTSIHLVEHQTIIEQNEHKFEPCLQFHLLPSHQEIRTRRLV